MPETLRFKYKENLWWMIFMGVFGSAVAYAGFQMALENNRIVTIKGITLSAANSTIFFYAMGVIGLAVVLFGFLGIYKSLTLSQEIEISDTAISAPTSTLRKSIVSVPFSEITNLHRTKKGARKVGVQEFFAIHHTAGELVILRESFKNKDNFEKVISEINSRLGS